MVHYDSKEKTLVLMKSYLIDEELTTTKGVAISLAHMDEKSRQYCIAIAKELINFANGHEINHERLKKLVRVDTPKTSEGQNTDKPSSENLSGNSDDSKV